MAAFSDKNIKGLAVTGVNYRRYEGGSDPGFGVQVTAAGVKTFFINTRTMGVGVFCA